ncbi:MAG: pyridoxamine 5'-phosphate oxidase family protein [Polyangiaceae bacterium]|nr:pyridoxamine 5'-phosphate oxidase family protein [Myxococcales bacterium]MCB9588736.1 pyridoxamine 5'-phosphate oxidase family protein [Polyangiaceae bacterium]MCB9605294.1 pyridoxamine 5'-phosphate oxidase family protein [Polyangiaceae bacterium]
MRPAPFHSGEEALQLEAGVRDKMAAVGPRVIRDRMLPQHIELFEKLPTLFVGVLDAQGQPWASMVHGVPGFIEALGDHSLRITGKPLFGAPRFGLQPGSAVGLLGLEPHTRRRNRANGAIEQLLTDTWVVRIHQSFGNCPKYIHAREIVGRPERAPSKPRREGTKLSLKARQLIEASDTFFIASASGGQLAEQELGESAGAGVDISHRGGPVGFVRVVQGTSEDLLLVPDYPGNLMFNTLGNLLVWPRAGLLFVDWQTGDLLQLAASATLREATDAWSSLDAQRQLELRISEGWFHPAAIPLNWSPPKAPPQFSSQPSRER